MDKEEAISYCYTHRVEYEKGFEESSEGMFDALILLLQEEDITPEQLPEYGMEIPSAGGSREE